MKVINQMIRQASSQNLIIPGFNVFGHEEALAVVKAAERANSPVLLMVNRSARQVMAIRHWGGLLSSIAKTAEVPIGVHLDHCTDLDLIQEAIETGFTSVMYDGSKLSLDENIKYSRMVVQKAAAWDVAVEGEVGSVPYDDLGEQLGDFTTPQEAQQIVEETGMDWLAISVGNIHRLTDKKAVIDFQALNAIEKAISTPLVIHGASGIGKEDIEKLKKSRVAKVNIGTALRQVFGQSLRREILASPQVFDRITLFKNPMKQYEEKAYEMICQLKQ